MLYIHNNNNNQNNIDLCMYLLLYDWLIQMHSFFLSFNKYGYDFVWNFRLFFYCFGISSHEKKL